MAGPYKVTSNTIGDAKMYRVYRLLDTTAVDCSGNREFVGGWMTDDVAAEALADQMNLANPEEVAR